MIKSLSEILNLYNVTHASFGVSSFAQLLDFHKGQKSHHGFSSFARENCLACMAWEPLIGIMQATNEETEIVYDFGLFSTHVVENQQNSVRNLRNSFSFLEVIGFCPAPPTRLVLYEGLCSLQIINVKICELNKKLYLYIVICITRQKTHSNLKQCEFCYSLLKMLSCRSFPQ